jgi:LacI family transcriptional regulator
VKKAKPTIIDVAHQANVSIATVSRVLNGTVVNEDNRRAVKKAISKLSYRHNKVARGLVTGKSGIIGVIIPDISGYLYGHLARGIEEVVMQHHLHMMIVTNIRETEQEKANITLLLERQVDGIIVLGSYLSDRQLGKLGLGKTPIVFIQRELPHPKSRYSSIDFDNRVGIEQAVDYLFKAGHQKIAHINGLRRDGADREVYFRDAMLRHGVKNPLVLEGDFTEQCGVAGAKGLEQHPEITAVICSNDQSANGLYQGLRSRGLRVAQDLSVIGFDNEPWSAYMDPPLTTLHQPAKEAGQLAAKQVLAELSGEARKHCLVPVSFIERASVNMGATYRHKLATIKHSKNRKDNQPELLP